MARSPVGSAQTAIREQLPANVVRAAPRAGYFLPRLRPEINTGRPAKCVSFDLMVRLLSATFSQYLVRGFLAIPFLLAAAGSIGCATPVPFALPNAGADGLGGDPSTSGGTQDLGGAPAVGGDDSSGGSIVAGGDASSAGMSSGGASNSAGADTFGGAPTFGGSSNSAGAPAGGGGSAGKSGTGGSATAGSPGSAGAGTAGAGTAGAASAGASSGGATAGGSCAAAFASNACLNLSVGSKVSLGGHNWTCSDANCRNCDNHPECAPGMSTCPWGAVWTDNGGCT
jgi:hypothetical protein